MKFKFQDIPVYIKAKEFYKSIMILLKENKQDRFVTDQISRASLSIVLNIAEGYGRFHKADKRNFYVTARASLNECVACLDIIFDSEIPEKYIADAESLGKMLSGLVKAFS